ncbi:MAG: biopolymer transport protein ExbD [Pirellulaceae bacterium]|jgi:biopolymer transport protein ExbD
MPIPIQCLNCQARYAAPDNVAGKSIRCPQCQAAIPVPLAAENSGGDQDDAAPTGDNDKEYNDKEYNDKEYNDKEYNDKEYNDKEYNDRGDNDRGDNDRGDNESWRGTPPESTPTTPAGKVPNDSDGGGNWDDEDEEDYNKPNPDAIAIAPDGERIETEMDMTPMVDVTFLLLIFFMVTASFSLQKSLEVPTPTESDQASTNARPEDEPPEEDPDYVIVHVDAFNTFQVTTPEWEEEAPSVQDLHIQLRRAREGSGGTVPTKLIVRANIEALHEKVVSAIDAGSAVGMEEVQLMTVEDD